jgi:hypothetical protein
MLHYKIINHYLCNKYLKVKDDSWTIIPENVTCKKCKAEMKRILEKQK